MKVFVTFDIEIWCPSWTNLDRDFPVAYDRYVLGHSRHGDYAMPKTLEILNRYGIHGVFFVEPLFAARFGLEYLARIVELIQTAGHEVQLHLHPEWTDEIRPPLLNNVSSKRQHLSHYTVTEQITLISHGLRLLREAGAINVTAFRAGNFGVNADTYVALGANGITFDSSLNATSRVSAPDLQKVDLALSPRRVGEVVALPISVFRDGFGRLRHAQVGACGSSEIEHALTLAEQRGEQLFVLFSHNFEMLMPKTSSPDWIVVRRFEKLCRAISENKQWKAAGFSDVTGEILSGENRHPSQVGKVSTAVRLVEQAIRNTIAYVHKA